LIIDLKRDKIGQAKILPNSTGLKLGLKYQASLDIQMSPITAQDKSLTNNKTPSMYVGKGLYFQFEDNAIHLDYLPHSRDLTQA
jgi:hypothetical protein